MDLLTKLLSVDSFGTVAAVITTFAFGLQALHTVQTRDVSGISLGMYLAFFIGVALWLLYGFMLNATPLIVSQTITLAFSGVVLVMKIRAGRTVKTLRCTRSTANTQDFE